MRTSGWAWIFGLFSFFRHCSPLTAPGVRDQEHSALEADLVTLHDSRDGPRRSGPAPRVVLCPPSSPGRQKARAYAEFLIIGFPKCGSTTISRHIFSHPSIYNFQLLGKDPGAHTEDTIFKGHGTIDLERYFKKVPPCDNIRGNTDEKEFHCDPEACWRVLGHYKPMFVTQTFVARQVSHFFPRPEALRFVAVIRNPVAAAISGYWFTRRSSQIASLDYEEASDSVSAWISTRVTSLFRVSECALANGSLLRCDKVAKGWELTTFFYWIHLQQWLSQFPRSRRRLLLLSLEQYIRSPVESFTEIINFLGLDTIDGTKKTFKSNLSLNRTLGQKFNAGQLQSSSYKVREESLAILQEFFRPHDQKLVQLLESSKVVVGLQPKGGPAQSVISLLRDLYGDSYGGE